MHGACMGLRKSIRPRRTHHILILRVRSSFALRRRGLPRASPNADWRGSERPATRGGAVLSGQLGVRSALACVLSIGCHIVASGMRAKTSFTHAQMWGEAYNTYSSKLRTTRRHLPSCSSSNASLMDENGISCVTYSSSFTCVRRMSRARTQTQAHVSYKLLHPQVKCCGPRQTWNPPAFFAST